MAEFDPYRKWLGIPPHEQPPNYYRLLGLPPFESDADAIGNAADRQMAHLRTFQGGRNSAISQKILNEVAAARICLLDPKKRAQYDARLQAEIETHGPPAPPPDAESPPIANRPPVVEAPPILRGRGRPGSLNEPYRPRRKNNRWQGPMVTLIVSGIGLLIAGWCIYIAIEKHLFEPTVIRNNTPDKPPRHNPPPPSMTPPSTTPPSKGVQPSTTNPPADVGAENEKIGKRLCFMKGNWREGLPKLAATANEELKSLAQKELAAPEDTADRLAVADGWWKVSEKYQPPADETIRRHAVEWYKKVIGDLEDS